MYEDRVHLQLCQQKKHISGIVTLDTDLPTWHPQKCTVSSFTFMRVRFRVKGGRFPPMWNSLIIGTSRNHSCFQNDMILCAFPTCKSGVFQMRCGSAHCRRFAILSRGNDIVILANEKPCLKSVVHWWTIFTRHILETCRCAMFVRRNVTNLVGQWETASKWLFMYSPLDRGFTLWVIAGADTYASQWKY